jgi:outer membrane protein OmpA-like peptidoglycan-associated protein
MSQPFIENTDIHPNELKDILVGFLGQTYSEVSRYDNHLVSPNQFLAPKKQEFQKTAERVLQEAAPRIPQQQLPQPIQPIQHYTPQQPIPVQPQQPQQTSDPNQLEFSFDNSVTAKSIDEKLDNLEKRLKKLDTMLSKVLSYLESHESQDN